MARLRALSRCSHATLALAVLTTMQARAWAQSQAVNRDPPNHDILTESRWEEIQRANDRALAWLASQQRPNGSFRGPSAGQPAITGLCLMAFMSNGRLPGEGPYGENLTRAVDFIMAQQKRNGLLSIPGEDGPVTQLPSNYHHELGVAGSYNHAIGSLALSEAYATTGGSIDEPRLREAIQNALTFALIQQGWRKTARVDDGGWRYLHQFAGSRADLSVTGWYLKFLRSAQNAGFNVPEKSIEIGVRYVLECYSTRQRTFLYTTQESHGHATRAMPGVGILALAHTSQHSREEAVAAANMIARYRFRHYNGRQQIGAGGSKDRYHYSLFMCSMAMYQFGGEHWNRFFPPVVDTLLRNQNRDGSWDAEANHDAMYGNAYTTALMVMALSAPNQVLPIYQR